MLPNLSNTIRRFSQSVVLIRTTEEIINHKPQNTEEYKSIKAVIQPAQKSKLNKDLIDWSLGYLWVHSLETIKKNDKIEYKGKEYRAFEDANYSDYGYYETTFEEIK